MATLGKQRLFVFSFRDSAQMTTALFLLLGLFSSSALCQSSHTDFLFNIIEEQSIGTYIGAITENQYLYKSLTPSQKKQLNYRLLDQSRYPASLFRVDESSGRIYVANRIDRESEECYQQPTCTLEFNVALRSSSIPFSNIATVLVKVVDKNDNPPYFLAQGSGTVVLNISEFTPIGTALKMSGAADRDHDSTNTVKRYAQTAYTSVFSINSSTNLDGTFALDITLLQPLDREVISSYHFSILAFDGGSPPLSAALAVEIRVTDENDNAPVFVNDIYVVEIRDEMTPGQVILKVSASDMDSSEHSKVYYQFSSIQRQQLEQKFHVDEVTGEIKLVSELAPGDHQLIVEALDASNPSLKSQTVVRVKVISSKNNPPSLQINTLSNGSNSFVEVSEDAGQGAFVAFVFAEDRDQGHRGEITCYLDNDILRLEALAGKGYTLALHKAIDRETSDSYNITVACSDNGQPPLSTSKSLLVIVTDVNDNPPKFRWDTFSHIVPEGNYSNRHVIQVTATDPDMGKNAELIYSIDNSARPLFRIDPMSGIISATGQLDRETTPFYTFKVHATDRGQSPNTASANVIITLEDVNDQYPTFSKPIFEFRIPENIPDKTLLGMLSAYDYDKGNNGKFEFFYARSVDRADPFLVTTDGKIWTSGELDREQRDSYSFTVMVRDKGLPPKITYASVVVTVLDINDNAPRIHFPASANHTIHVTTVPESGMVLVKIVAYDPDAAENGSLHFVVFYGNKDGALDIDLSSGAVTVKDVSKLHNKRVYRLVVGVQDYGLPPRGINITILVDVHFDNNSNMLQRETEGEAKAEDYIMIAAGVTSTTVVLSVIIIAAVYFFLRQNRQNHGKHPAAKTLASIHEDGEFYTTIPASHGNLYDDEKCTSSLEEKGDEHNAQTAARLNDDAYNDGSFNMKQKAMEAFKNAQRKTEDGFSRTIPMAEEGNCEMETRHSVPHTYGNDGNFASVLSGKKANILKHHHKLVPRQVEEVASDTSGDTGTNDSGRGGSEDDANNDHILHGTRGSQGDDQLVTSSQPSTENERYSRFPSPATPKGDPYKSYHVRFDTRPHISSNTISNSDPVLTSQKTVSFSPSVDSSPGPSLPMSRTSRKGSFTSSAYKDVSFTPLPQHSPQRILSTFSSSTQPTTSFTTFQKDRSSSQQLATTESGTTTSGSYTNHPKELRVDSYNDSGVTM